MTLRKALLAATMMTLPALAHAQPVSGPYIGIGAGANWVNNPERFNVDGDIRNNLLGVPSNVQVDNVGKANFDLGYVGAASLGWGFGNGLRVEAEGNYRSNEVDSIRGLGLAPIGRTGGFQSQYGVMGNVFYDFDPGFLGIGPSYVQPYLGAGAGYAWTNWSNVRGTSNAPGGANGFSVYSDDIDKGRFAYQGIAGVAVPFTWLGVTGLTLTAEYRFFSILDPEMNVQVRDRGNRLVNGGKVELEKYNHSAMLGLRYALFQPPPAPAAAPMEQVAPAQQPARTYLVFFDFDRADLTSRAREIIGEAAQNSRRVQSTRIEVAGHADRSGSAQYNQRLSQRRAEAVASELVRDGVNRSDIGVTAYGESRPLVPTADGVREPQNRRVEIVLR